MARRRAEPAAEQPTRRLPALGEEDLLRPKDPAPVWSPSGQVSRLTDTDVPGMLHMTLASPGTLPHAQAVPAFLRCQMGMVWARPATTKGDRLILKPLRWGAAKPWTEPTECRALVCPRCGDTEFQTKHPDLLDI
ncbi:MAG TPA: hypothetical protein VM536_02085 [Chloroflexia bacterium]|nr:hypothetical protein [Chloroflexia bacterium]